MIEDVDYLKANSELESTVFFVDSSLRNRLHYADPSEYVIQFDQPYRLVTGFDVLDCAIPTTEYIIETSNSVLDVSTVQHPPTVADADTSIGFRELTHCRPFSVIFESTTETRVLVVDDSVVVVPASGIVATVFTAFVRTAFPLVPVQPRAMNCSSAFYMFSFDGANLCVERSVANQAFIDILESASFSLTRLADSTYTLIRLVAVSIDEATYTALVASNSYRICVKNYHDSIPIGNYDINTLISAINNTFEVNGIHVFPLSADATRQGKILISSDYLVVLNTSRRNLSSNIGFDTFPRASDRKLYAQVTVGNNALCAMSIPNTSTAVTEQAFVMYAPGLVNLLGTRFIILRIKEIEDSLIGSFGFSSFTPGIGMFKLALNNDITNLRFDFTNLVRKPFHPIGKISKLTIRFENSDGTLYDFKGVNHQLQMMIKFLVPTQKKQFKTSILNPSYNPDFMAYMSNNKSIQYKEDSDDEVEALTSRDREAYRDDVIRYDYDSSDAAASREEDEEEDGEEDGAGDL